MNTNQIYYQPVNSSTSQPQVVFQIPVTQMGQYCQPIYNQNGQIIIPSYQTIFSLNTGYSMNEVAKVYQSIVNWFKECVKYELLTPSVFYQNCISQIDTSFYTNLRFTIDTLHSMCTKMMEDLDTQKKALHAKQLSISNSDFLCQACDTIIANLKALKAIIEKYKTVPWSVALYDGIILKKIYVIGSKQLQPMFDKWEKELQTKSSLNNPKIPLKFIEEHGILIYEEGMEYPLNPAEELDTAAYVPKQKAYFAKVQAEKEAAKKSKKG